MLDKSVMIGGVPQWEWSPNDSFTQALKTYLPGPDGEPDKFHIHQMRAPLPELQRMTNFEMTQDDPIDRDFDLEFTDYFTLCYMDRLSGFKICFVPNLLDHLRFRKLRTKGFSVTVFAFHHATILHHLVQSDE